MSTSLPAPPLCRVNEEEHYATREWLIDVNLLTAAMLTQQSIPKPLRYYVALIAALATRTIFCIAVRTLCWH
jgi:hypothetical protein